MREREREREIMERELCKRVRSQFRESSRKMDEREREKETVKGLNI